MDIIPLQSPIITYIANEAIHNRSLEGNLCAKTSQLVKKIFISIADLFLRLSPNYRELKHRMITKTEEKAELKPGEKSTTDPLLSPTLKVALVAGAVVLLGVCIYYSCENPKPIDFDSLKRSLNPVCEEAIKNYCKSGVCLKDHIDPRWRPYVHFEDDRVLCSVDLLAKNCATLVGQPTVEMRYSGNWPFIFEKNYEMIHFHLPPTFSKLAKKALEKFNFFKSHIFCRSNTL